ncbi:MAG: peptidylprolyl isomerase [Anaerolineae bacterium]|nr:peptidylprolyl isomerase [Anaerolineae bacterium]
MGQRYGGTMENRHTWRRGLWRVSIGLVVIVLAGCASRETVPPPVPYVGLTPTAPQVPSSTTVSGEALAAAVDGHPVYAHDYQKWVSEWEAAFMSQSASLAEQEKLEMLAQGRRQVLDVMIEQALIEQAAEREGVSIPDTEVESVIARDIEENGGQEQFNAWLKANNWTRQEYTARQHSMMLSSLMFERVTGSVPTKAEQVHARHILVESEAEARSLLAQLQGGADFATVARQSSLDPSTKESGGDLGFFPRGTLVVTAVEDAAFELPVGQISDVIQSAMGYHIVQVIERVQDMPLSEESWQELREATFRRWVSELWESADIEILAPR